MKRARLLKYFLIASVITIIIISSALILFVHYFPEDKLLGIITERAEKALDKKVEIQSIQYGFEGIVLNNVKLYNGLSAEDELIMSAQEASIRLSLLPLLNKQLIISRINLNNLKINLTFENGRLNIADLFETNKNGDKPAVSTKISRISISNASLILKDPPGRLKPLEGEYQFNGILILDKKEEFYIKNCRAVLPEDRGIITSDLIDISLSDEGFKLTADVNCLECTLPWVYKFSINKNLSLPFERFSGDVKDLTITKTFVKGFVDGKSLLSNSTYIEAEGVCRVDIPDVMINLLNVNGKLNKSSVLINEIRFPAGGSPKKINIADVDIDLNQLKPFFTSIPLKLYGRVSGNIESRNNKISGNIKLHNAGYDRDGGIISAVNTEITLKDNCFYKENIKTMVYNQPCFISISTSDGNFNKIAVNISAKEFRLKRDMTKSTKTDFGPVRIKPAIYGKINIDKLNIKKADILNFTLDYSLQDGHLLLDRIYGNSMGGLIKSRCTVDLSEKKPSVIFLLSFENIRVQNLAAIVTESTGRFFGIARGEANIRFNLGSKEDIYNSLKGNVEFFIDKGKLVNTGIQKGLSLWLSELEYKLKDLEFNTIYGNFNISGNNYDIKSFLFNAPDIKLNMDGFFRKSLEEQKMAGNIKIGLEFNQNFIQDIPNITRLLTRPFLNKRGNWYIMSFQDKGDDITNSNNIKPL